MRVVVPLPYDVSMLAHGRNLRIVHLLRELSSICRITCVTAGEEWAARARLVLPHVEVIAPNPDQSMAAVSRDCVADRSWQERAMEFFGRDPGLEAEFVRQCMTADAALGFDVRSVAYLAAVASTRRPDGGRTRVVCDLIDDPWLHCRSQPIRNRLSAAGLKTAFATAIVRRRVLPAFDALTAVAPRDAASLARATGHDVTVVPNGVVTPESLPLELISEPLVIFTGAMDYPPNESAARHLVDRIWPRVRRGLRDLERHAKIQIAGQLAIVGANPTPEIRRLADMPGVTVTGRVDSLLGWLRRARVAVAPMVSGCGIKNKVLEACAAACPVIATPLGAAGLPVGAENGIIVARGARRFSEEILAMLIDGATAKAIGAAGQRMVRERFTWPGSADRLAEVLAPGAGLATARRASPGVTLPEVQPGAAPIAQQTSSDKEALIHAAP